MKYLTRSQKRRINLSVAKKQNALMTTVTVLVLAIEAVAVAFAVNEWLDNRPKRTVKAIVNETLNPKYTLK